MYHLVCGNWCQRMRIVRMNATAEWRHQAMSPNLGVSEDGLTRPQQHDDLLEAVNFMCDPADTPTATERRGQGSRQNTRADLDSLDRDGARHM